MVTSASILLSIKKKVMQSNYHQSVSLLAGGRVRICSIPGSSGKHGGPIFLQLSLEYRSGGRRNYSDWQSVSAVDSSTVLAN